MGYIIHAATLILFENTPHLLHSAFARHHPLALIGQLPWDRKNF